MPIATRGSLCLRGSAQVTGSTTTLEVGGNVTMSRTTSSGNRNPTAATGWTSSSNVYSSNGTDATYAIAASGQSANLDVTGFGFTIPADATIVGIQASIERAASSLNIDRGLSTSSCSRPARRPGTTRRATTDWTTTDSIRDYGDSSDLWGTTWTQAQVERVELRHPPQGAQPDDLVAHGVRRPRSDHGLVPAGPDDDDRHLRNAARDRSGRRDLQVRHRRRRTRRARTRTRSTGNTIGTAPQNLSKPAVDLAYWYENAKPGPKHNCTTGSFPGGFDNNSYMNNSLPGSAEVTPSTSSYTCQVKDANSNILGELSWNHVTDVLKIKGTIFIDGDFRFDDDGADLPTTRAAESSTRPDDLEFDELVCAGGSGSTNCVTNGMQNWDPTQNMMIVLAGGDSEYDQGGTQQQSVPSGFQGLIYANGDCTVHENFHTSGPDRLQPHPAPVRALRLADVLRLAAARLPRRGSDVLGSGDGRRLRRRPRPAVRLIKSAVHPADR